jgi:hypothetical protein
MSNSQLTTVKPRQRLVLIPWSEIHLLPKRESLVRGLLDGTAMSVVFGGSGSGKTFWTLGLGACIALNIEWRGRPVRHGAVCYIAAEGGLGIEERLTAYRIHHNVKVDGVPFYVIPEQIDLCKADTDVFLLLQRIRDLPKEPKLELIVIDTLSRTMAGGNENSPDDMGRFVRHCDKLRIETGAHVLVIHHTGKDDAKGARGHSLLKAAADTEIEISKNSVTNIGTATVAKQRDHAGGDVFGFSLHQVEIGQDADGLPITSCVAIEAEASKQSGSDQRLTRNQQTMFTILHGAGERGLTLEEWNDQTREAGIGVKRRADLTDIRAALKANRLIRQTLNGWAVNHQSP